MKRTAMVLALGGLFCSLAVGAQGTIWIGDADGGPVVGAIVRATGVSSGEVFAGRTDAQGQFALSATAQLSDEQFRVEVRGVGFQPLNTVATAAELRAGARFVLQRSVFAQEVTVTASMPEMATEEQIDGGDLARGMGADVAESLRARHGMAAARRGPINLDPTVRGLQQTQVAMLVDDTRTFSACPGRMDSEISHVSPHAVREVQVVKGPYALTWGSGTLSAIRLETHRPSFSAGAWQSQGRAALQYGSNAGANDAFLAWGGATERFTAYVLGNYRSGSDYEDGGGAPVPGDYQSADFRWSLGWQATESLELRYDGGYQEQHDIDMPGKPMDAVEFFTRSHRAELRWLPETGPDEVFGSLYVNNKDHLMNNDNKPSAVPNPDRMPPFGVDASAPTTSDTTGGSFRVNWSPGALRWSVGGDFYLLYQDGARTITRRDNGMLINYTRIWPDAELDNVGIYGQVMLDRQGYQLGGTLRVDRVDATAGEVSDYFLENTTGDLDQSETNVSAALSTTIDLSSTTALTLGLGRTVRTATAIERYSDRFPSSKFQVSAEFMGNPGLDPEKSLEFDVGLKTDHRTVEFTADLFYRVIDDYITMIEDPDLAPQMGSSLDTVFRYINGEEALYYGGEARIVHRFTPDWQWRGSVNYSWAEDTAFDEPVFGIAPLQGEIAVRYGRQTIRAWWVETSAWLVARQDRVATSRYEVETPGYAVLALRGRVELGKGIGLRAGVENLTDHAYADHLNAFNPFTKQRINEIGRNVYVGLSLDF